MNILAIDTSTRYAAVCLMTKDEKRYSICWYSDQNHGVELMPNINKLLIKAKITPKNISHISVCLGPGGFSAIRTGIATTIGIAMANNATVYGFNTHIIESLPHTKIFREEIISLIPAGKNIYSWAKFNTFSTKKTTNEGVDNLETILKFNNNVLFCGESSLNLNGIIESKKILTKSLPSRDPNIMLDLSKDIVEKNNFFKLAELKPIYSRQPSISKPKYK